VFTPLLRGCHNLPRCDPPAFGAIKVPVETDQRHVVLLSRCVLIRIIKVKPETVSYSDEMCHVFWPKRDQTDRTIDKNILDKSQELRLPVQAIKDDPNRM